MSGRCKTCGSVLPQDLLAGHCPACLVQVSLGCEAPLEPDEFSIGAFPRSFGDYEVLDEVARGGMGVVYRAQQISLKRQVALKMILSSQFASRAAIDRFRTEALTAASLQHPNIVAIHEVGEAEGLPYFTMDFIEGRDLAEVVRSGPLPPKRAARYVEQVSRAIHHAHQRGVLHRDLKPANVLIDAFDQPRITDFGLAKKFPASASSFTGDPPLTQTGQALGSPNYMAPEQTSGGAAEVGAGADIYSLGALLYHLVTGRPPFAAGTIAETVHQVLFYEPARPRVLNPTLPADVETICLKCLEKEPSSRFPTAEAVAEELARFLRDEPIATLPLGRISRTWRWCRRNRAVAALGMLAGFLAFSVLMALVMVAADNVRIRQEQSQKDVALRQRAVALEAAQRSEQRAREELFSSLRSQAQARRFSRQPGQRLDSLAAVAEAARIRSDPSLRDEAIAAMALPDVSPGPTWSGYATGTLAVAFDGSYQRYARLDEQGDISVRSVPDDQEIRSLRTGSGKLTWDDGSLLLLSPDGVWVVALDYKVGLHLWRSSDSRPSLERVPARPTTGAFSPDSRQLAVADDGAVLLYDLGTDREPSRWRPRSSPHSLRFHPNNRTLAVGYADADQVSIYDTVLRKEVASLPVGASSGEVVAWHPDGKHLAVAGSDPRIQIWDVDAGHMQAKMEGHVQQVTELSFDPEGGLLASQSWDGMVRLWEPQTGRQVMQIPYGPQVRISDDGKWLGFRVSAPENRLQLLSLSTAGDYQSFCPGVAYDGQLGPDGRLVALITEKGVGIWELPTRRELAFLPAEQVRSAVFSPNERELLICGPGEGLQRWPMRFGGQPADQLDSGPSMKIPLPWTPMRAAFAPGGRSAAIISEEASQTLLLDLASNRFTEKSPLHTVGCFVAFSPDGQWLANAGWHEDVVELWEAASQRLVHKWPVHGPSQIVFTPDSRTLVISQPGEFSFWDVATRTARLRLSHEVLFPGHVAFSADRKLMALEMAPGIVDLKDAVTARTVARLEDPFGDRSTWMAFTPDGTKLITTARYSKIAHVWDLSKLRTQLRAIGLDWDWPEFPLAQHSELKPGDVAQKPPLPFLER